MQDVRHLHKRLRLALNLAHCTRLFGVRAAQRETLEAG